MLLLFFLTARPSVGNKLIYRNICSDFRIRVRTYVYLWNRMRIPGNFLQKCNARLRVDTFRLVRPSSVCYDWRYSNHRIAIDRWHRHRAGVMLLESGVLPHSPNRQLDTIRVTTTRIKFIIAGTSLHNVVDWLLKRMKHERWLLKFHGIDYQRSNYRNKLRKLWTYYHAT